MPSRPRRGRPTVITYRVAEAAEILAVSDDTVRAGSTPGASPRSAPRAHDGRRLDLAELAEHLSIGRGRGAGPHPRQHGQRAQPDERIVTRVKRDHVMAQVEMICGPYRVVSLMSSDAADDLGLEPGVRAIASVKSTNVVVEVPK